MHRHDGRSFLVICLAAAGALAIVGCDSGGSSDQPAAPPATTDAGAPEPEQGAQAEFDAPATANLREESDVKLATAESRVRPPDIAPVEPGDVNATDPQLRPPRKLPAAEAPLPLDDVDAADLTMPQVTLTEHHAAMCRVGVGEKFPDLQLPDLAGEQHSLSQLFGDKLTLVVFWHGKEPTSLEELADLARYHQPRFGQRGLAIVAINTGDQPQLAAELAEQAGAEFTILSDADGEAFKQVATEKIPRTYLLDPTGTVLWLDLEYSPTALRDMVQAIRYSLAHE